MVEITSDNFSGQQANIIYTPNGSDLSFSLGVQTIPFIFNSFSVGENIDIYGTYSINILNANCTYILLI